MSTFVIVHGAWGSPAEMEPVVEPLESAGHAVITVDLPCVDAGATLEQYAAAVRAVLPDDTATVVLDLFASLTDPGAEGTGIYFGKDPHTLYVNIQHSADDNGDGIWAITNR